MGIRFEHSDMLNASLASSLWQAIMDKVVFVMGSKDLKTKIMIFLNMCKPVSHISISHCRISQAKSLVHFNCSISHVNKTLSYLPPSSKDGCIQFKKKLSASLKKTLLNRSLYVNAHRW